MRIRKIIPRVDPKLLIKDAAKLMPDASRRGFLRGAASLGALSFLTGCDIIDGPTAESVLRKISEFNDGAQAALFSRTKLAPTYPDSAITRPFPFNAYYSEDEAPVVDGASYKLEISGLVDNKKPWTLAELHALPEVSRATSASRAGAPSAPGRARHWRISSNASGLTPAPNMSGSNAPRATPTPSTCRPRCIRRRRCRSSSTTRYCRRPTGFR
jgi:hypothetical protein